MQESRSSGSVGGEGGNLLAYPAPLTDLNNRWPVTAQPTDLLYFVQRTNMRRPEHAFDLHYSAGELHRLKETATQIGFAVTGVSLFVKIHSETKART